MVQWLGVGCYDTCYMERPEDVIVIGTDYSLVR